MTFFLITIFISSYNCLDYLSLWKNIGKRMIQAIFLKDNIIKYRFIYCLSQGIIFEIRTLIAKLGQSYHNFILNTYSPTRIETVSEIQFLNTIIQMFRESSPNPLRSPRRSQKVSPQRLPHQHTLCAFSTPCIPGISPASPAWDMLCSRCIPMRCRRFLSRPGHRAPRYMPG
jgi:hypothetical protein